MSSLRMSPAEAALLEARGYQIGKLTYQWGPTQIYRGTFKGQPIAVKAVEMHSYNSKETAMGVLLLKLISHPNVVQYLDLAYLLSSTSLLIFMEYMAGGNLGNYLINPKTPITEPVIAALFRQIVEALSYMHGLGYAHRDLKSENILLDESLKVAKIADFATGFMVINSPAGRLTMVNDAKWRGTMDYLPPEVLQIIIADCQANGGRSSSASDPVGAPFSPFKADVWSMGVLLFEMLHNGLHPFMVIPEPSAREQYALQHEELSFGGDISPMAQGVVKKLLIIEPKDRPQIGDILKDEWFTWAVKQEGNPAGNLKSACSIS